MESKDSSSWRCAEKIHLFSVVHKNVKNVSASLGDLQILPVK